MIDPEEIARHFHNKGEEITPEEVKDLLASIANKFRAAIPGLPDNDEELFEIIIWSQRS